MINFAIMIKAQCRLSVVGCSKHIRSESAEERTLSDTIFSTKNNFLLWNSNGSHDSNMKFDIHSAKPFCLHLISKNTQYETSVTMNVNTLKQFPNFTK